MAASRATCRGRTGSRRFRSIATELLEADVEDVRTYGDVAVVKARLRWLARTEGRSLNGTYAVTDVFTNDQGRWRASWRISVRLTDR